MFERDLEKLLGRFAVDNYGAGHVFFFFFFFYFFFFFFFFFFF